MALRKVHFVQADVFSDSPFGGNPVVVVPEPGNMTADEMQAVARGMGLTETVFVQPARREDAAFRLRCFTPVTELPYSGHGLLGAAFVMAATGRLAAFRAGGTVGVEMGGSVRAVTLFGCDGLIQRAATVDCPARFGPVVTDLGKVSGALSVRTADILRTGLPVQWVQTTVATLVVPLRSLEVLRRIVPFGHVVGRLLRDTGASLLLAFCRQTLCPANDVHVRVFAPLLGVDEDSASGVANGALAAYLVRHGVVVPDPVACLRCEQGTETGRPSLIELQIDASHEPPHVRIGGRVRHSVEGSVYF